VNRRTIAAFDFDGTLTSSDSLVPFLATVAGREACVRRKRRPSFNAGDERGKESVDDP